MHECVHTHAGFLLLTVRACKKPSPVITDDASCINAFVLVQIQAPLISHSTCLAKLSFFQKAMAVGTIVNLHVILQRTGERICFSCVVVKLGYRNVRKYTAVIAN